MPNIPLPRDARPVQRRPLADRFTLPQDRRLSPDQVLGARDPKVAALLARTAEVEA